MNNQTNLTGAIWTPPARGLSQTAGCGFAEGRGLRAERELLLACVGSYPDKERRELIRRLAATCEDWDYFFQSAVYHHVSALTALALESFAPDIVPASPLVSFGLHYRSNARRNLFLMQELLRLIRSFRRHGLDVIPLKGPLLAAAAYGNISLREFVDLDILARKKDLPLAGKILADCGYEQAVAQTGDHAAEHVRSQLGLDFARKDGKVNVELHWSFLQRWLGFDLNLEELWESRQTIKIAQTEVRTLPPQILLLYLCAHGTKHHWSRLCWVVDVAQVVRTQPDLDWAALLKTARRTGSCRTLFLGLNLANWLLGTFLPVEVQRQIRQDRTATGLALQIQSDYYGSGLAVRNDNPGLANDWFHLRAKERWRHRFRYLRYSASWLFSPSKKDRQWVRLPDSLSWLYLLLRPVRALWSMVQASSRH